jgi:hypothetical protein
LDVQIQTKAHRLLYKPEFIFMWEKTPDVIQGRAQITITRGGVVWPQKASRPEATSNCRIILADDSYADLQPLH